MSLAINVDLVYAVLLADGWHEVETGSFGLDSYEFGEVDQRNEFQAIHGGGNSGVCATGFTFKDRSHTGRVSGPLTAIIAVREQPFKSEPRPWISR
jgi:hypothetical protein